MARRQLDASSCGVSCVPIIRWAGGKRSLVPRLRQFMPNSFHSYYEPMLGSGALFFSVLPRRPHLADINCELMNFYEVLGRQPLALYSRLSALRSSKVLYCSFRKHNPSHPLDRAVRFFYLIRLSWNGLYRVNKNGRFNVPFGGRRPKRLLTLQEALAASRALKGARLMCGDFRRTTAGIRPGGFVYFDPPYPKGSVDRDGFARYSATGFTLDDHKQLANYASRLADRGVHVLVTEAARKEILQLYSGAFHVTLIRTPSLIAAASEHRRDAYEAVLTSYSVESSPPLAISPHPPNCLNASLRFHHLLPRR